MDDRKTLTAPEVADKCGVTSKTVHRWIKAGHFPGTQKGLGKTSPYLIPKNEVEAFITRMSQGLEEEWLKRRAQEQAQEATPPVGPNQPSSRAVFAALAETLHQFEERETGTQFALIVEDDPDAGDIFQFTLTAVGFNSRVVGSGRKALSLMASMVPDVIVLDLHLPDVPGTDILRHIRADAKLAEVPVIVATAHPQMAETIQDEADLVLIKPVKYKVLQDRAVELARVEKRV